MKTRTKNKNKNKKNYQKIVAGARIATVTLTITMTTILRFYYSTIQAGDNQSASANPDVTKKYLSHRRKQTNGNKTKPNQNRNETKQNQKRNEAKPKTKSTATLFDPAQKK